MRTSNATAMSAASLLADYNHLSVRAAANVLGVSSSTVHRMRQAAGTARAATPKKTAKVKPSGTDDMAAAISALAASQAENSRLLGRLLTERKHQIRVPNKKALKTERPSKPLAGGTLAEPEEREVRKVVRRYIASCAQNNSLPHTAFIQSLQTMARDKGAEIGFTMETYNKNAWEKAAGVTRESKGIWYSPEVEPYLVRGPIRLADDLIFCAELDRLPTAVDPLSGLESYSKGSSGIVGHPKVAMRSLAVMKGEPPRFMYSTGCVTQRNYVDRLAGQKAAHHHTFGALYIEIDEDGAWFARQLIAGENGEFQDLDTVYTPTGSYKARVAAIVYGDLHAEKMDDWMVGALWGAGGLRETLNPEFQILHDVGDFTARNHHNIEDGFFLLERSVAGQETVEGDMQRVADVLTRAEHEDAVNIVVDANHQQQAMLKWLRTADIRKDPTNKRYFHKLSLRVCEAIEARDRDFQVYEWTVRDKATLGLTRFLRPDESFSVSGVECGIHGHLGPNGAKGSPKSYRQIGKRTVTAHTHSAGIVDGVWTAGVSGRLDMGYNAGPGSWSHSHVIIYATGKRSIITHRGAQWRGTPVEKPRFRVKAVSSDWRAEA